MLDEVPAHGDMDVAEPVEVAAKGGEVRFRPAKQGVGLVRDGLDGRVKSVMIGVQYLETAGQPRLRPAEYGRSSTW